MRTLFAIALVAALAGCATQPEMVWEHPEASQQRWGADQGQCQAQAFAVPSAPALQVAAVYAGCMRGKGWQRVPK